MTFFAKPAAENILLKEAQWPDNFQTLSVHFCAEKIYRDTHVGEQNLFFATFVNQAQAGHLMESRGISVSYTLLHI